jgi:hypothetical protein
MGRHGLNCDPQGRKVMERVQDASMMSSNASFFPSLKEMLSPSLGPTLFPSISVMLSESY